MRRNAFGVVSNFVAIFIAFCGTQVWGDVVSLSFGPETFEHLPSIYNFLWSILLSTLLLHILFVIKTSVSCNTALLRNIARLEQVLFFVFFLIMLFQWRSALVDDMIHNYNEIHSDYRLDELIILRSGHIGFNMLNRFPPHIAVSALFLLFGGFCSGVWKRNAKETNGGKCHENKKFHKWCKVILTAFFLICSLLLLCLDSHDGMWVQGAKVVPCSGGGHGVRDVRDWERNGMTDTIR